MTNQLVTVQWFKKHFYDSHLVLLDASTVFNAQHTIPGAQHFDIKNVFSDVDSEFPNTFPSTSQFEKESQKLGINNDSHIIVFDDRGIFSSPRVWWMYRTMGHQKVSVLDGGLPAWKTQQASTANVIPPDRKKGNFKARFAPSALISYKQITQNIVSRTHQVIDARSQGRFDGIAPEPRKHIQSGHIRNSINLPYTDVLENGKYKSREELKSIFKKINIKDSPVIFSCGSGITACIILLALDLVSDQEKSVYDGSWTEWAEKQGLFTE